MTTTGETFPRWAWGRAIDAIERARTIDELRAVERLCDRLASDPGRDQVAAALRRRWVELAIQGGEAVAKREHLRAVEAARAGELRRVLEELAAMAAELDGEARLARGRGRNMEAMGKAEQARLLRRAARRIQERR